MNQSTFVEYLQNGVVRMIISHTHMSDRMLFCDGFLNVGTPFKKNEKQKVGLHLQLYV